MKYLVDANVFIEVLVKGPHFEKAREFFLKVPAKEIALTDFSLHSIRVVLARNLLDIAYIDFLEDIEENSVAILNLDVQVLKILIHVRNQLNLNFDDAYQYLAAEKYDLVIVSYDPDFDKTPRGRKTPEEILMKNFP